MKYVDPSGYKQCKADAVQGTESPVERMGKAGDNLIKDDCHFLNEFGLKPNTRYEASGYNYSTDDLGRIKQAGGELSLKAGMRNAENQLKAGGDNRIIAPGTSVDRKSVV